MAVVKLSSNKQAVEVKILIVEDNAINAAALEMILKDKGIDTVFIAKSGKEAIQFFSENLDLIFMDINLPDTDGFKLTEYFRKDFPKKDTPIICWSTDADSQRRIAIEAGIDDFLPKPATPEDVEEILACWLPHLFLTNEKR